MEDSVDMRMISKGDPMEITPRDTYNFDEAVELTGHGKYNFILITTCSVISLAAALDMFGFSIIITASACDLNLGIRETGFLGSAPFAGLIFAFLWGYYADTQGRHKALILSTTVSFIFALLSSLSMSWQVLLVIKFIGCSFSAASVNLTMNYIGETTTSKYRNQYMFINNSFNLAAEVFSFSVAYLTLGLNFSVPMPWLNITFRPWRLLTIFLALPLGIGALMLFFLYESPKFLASSGKKKEALSVLEKMYQKNGGNKQDYPVKHLSSEGINQNTGTSFWSFTANQMVFIFKPPLLWTTLKLYLLGIISMSTGAVFIMWFPTMVNLLFNTITDGVTEGSFCERIFPKNNETIDVNTECNEHIETYTILSGMIYGVFYMSLNLAVSQVAAWRRLIIMITLFLSTVCGLLIDNIPSPLASLALFTLFQGPIICIGGVMSYFIDLYPVSCSGVSASLAVMVSRLAAFIGVNLIGAVIVSNCTWTFYGWSMLIVSGVIVSLFLPSDSIPKRKDEDIS